MTSIASRTYPRRAERRRATLGDVFMIALVTLLAGYAIFGKGFAYLGVPPLYIGEVMLLFGLASALRSGCLPATAASPAGLTLILLIVWVGFRVGQGYRHYGVEALRDGVIVLYAFYAFAVAAVLIERPARLDDLIRYYRRFAAIYVLVPPAALISLSALVVIMPKWPTAYGTAAGLPLVFLRIGELAIHLAGITIFTLLGFRRPRWWWTLALIAGIAASFALSRGGMLAFIVPFALAAFFAVNRQKVLQVLAIGVIAIGIAAAAGVSIRITGGRDINAAQLVASVTSIFGESTTGNLDGTKEWRMEWWRAIVHYTFEGPYFWSGKGFGQSLADDDGYNVGPSTPPLRSPHNIHMTFLSRAGVPGLALWLAMLATWFATLFGSAVTARRRGEPAWSQFFIFIACYALAALVDASFDVAIEGPMVGIWFWSLIGVGMGASIIYRARRADRFALGHG